MKKEDLKKLIGEDIGCWEIANVGYDCISKNLNLLLREFSWVGSVFSRDYKQYSGKTKKLKILDEFAFTYYENENFVNAIQHYIEDRQGLDVGNLDLILNNSQLISTTEIQTDWKNLLNSKNCLNVEEYNRKFIEELKTQLKIFYKNNKGKSKLLQQIKFLDNLGISVGEEQ